MQKDVAKETSAAVPAARQTIWQRLFGRAGGFHLPMAAKIAIGIVVTAVLILIILALYNNVPANADPSAAINYPQDWEYGWDVIKWIDHVVDWVVVAWEPFFSFINEDIVLRILLPFEDFLLWLPWWLVIALTGLLAWRVVGKWFGAIVVLFLGFMCAMGLIDLAMMTLAITFTSTLLCVVLGIPLGILAARNDRFDRTLRPILDMMQTMPIFVYLIPAVMLFGLGKTPAVMATCIYAIPPIIRLTNLGIRQVDAQVVEAGRAFGATPWQLLIKVQVPLAMPTVLAGLNQTVMLALAMVVVASYIAAKGLGTEVLNGIARVEPGRGIVAGTAVVFMAIILDRISQGFARRPEPRPAT